MPMPASRLAFKSAPNILRILWAPCRKARALSSLSVAMGLSAVPGIMLYVTCSSLMLIANKVALTVIPLPGLVFAAQLLFAAVFIQACSAVGFLRVDGITWHNLRLMLPYALSFAAGVYTNGRSLEHSNVETVIVFRACTPLLVSVIEWAALDRMLPSWRSSFSLLAMMISAAGYMLADGEFKLRGLRAYGWVTIYMLIITYSMVYGKALTSKLNFSSPVWGPSLYTNILSFPLMALLSIINDEMSKVDRIDMSRDSLGALVASSAIGVGISWSGWHCTRVLTATTYTILGVLCKLVSITINVLIWDKHASPLGIFWLIVCVLAGALYQPAPMKEQLSSAECDQRQPSAPKDAFIASEELQHVPSDSHLGEPSKELVSTVSV